MWSATCCGMELRRRSVCNQPKGLDGINPKGKYPRKSLMTYACGDYILTCGEITYQSFGLDKNKRKQRCRFLLLLACPNGFEPLAFRVGVWRAIQLCHGQIRMYYTIFGAKFQSYFDDNLNLRIKIAGKRKNIVRQREKIKKIFQKAIDKSFWMWYNSRCQWGIAKR